MKRTASLILIFTLLVQCICCLRFTTNAQQAQILTSNAYTELYNNASVSSANCGPNWYVGALKSDNTFVNFTLDVTKYGSVPSEYYVFRRSSSDNVVFTGTAYSAAVYEQTQNLVNGNVANYSYNMFLSGKYETTNSAKGGLQYIVPQNGKLTFSTETTNGLFKGVAGTDVNFAIYKNGSKIWPEDENAYTVSYEGSSLSLAQGLFDSIDLGYAEKDDTIEFVVWGTVREGSSVEPANNACQLNLLNPTLTVEPSEPSVDESTVLSYSISDILSKNAAENNINAGPVLAGLYNDEHTFSAAVSRSDWTGTNGSYGYNVNGLGYNNYNSNGLQSVLVFPNGSIASGFNFDTKIIGKNSPKGAIQFTVPKRGRLALTADNNQIFVQGTQSGVVYFAIYQNGIEIFNKTFDYTNTTDDFFGSDMSLDLGEVNEQDIITLAVWNNDSENPTSNSYSVLMDNPTFLIDETSDGIVPASNSYEQLLLNVQNKNNNGPRWYVGMLDENGVFNRIADSNAVSFTNGHHGYNYYDVAPRQSHYIYGEMQDADQIFAYNTILKGRYNQKSGLQYVAEADGNLSLTADASQVYCNWVGGGEINFAVYKDNKVIWPKNGAPLNLKFDEDKTWIFYDLFKEPLDLGSVKKGESIEVVIWGDGVTENNNEVNFRVANLTANLMTKAEAEATVVYGDANNDGKVDVIDLVRYKRHLADESIDISTPDSDVNGDNRIDTLDIVELRRYLLGVSLVLKPTATVSSIATVNNRPYVEYLGNPYLFYGVKLLPSDISNTKTSYDEYFYYAAQVGFRSVSIPITWQCFETAKDVYSTNNLQWIIDSAEKYNMSVQLNWYGCNVGSSFSAVPAYIKDDRITYPRLNEFPELALDLSNENFIAREIKAVNILMQYIAKLDVNNRIMMVQIENETENPSAFSSENVQWDNGESVSTYAFSGGQYNELKNIMSGIGDTIHNSKVNMVTRANFTCIPYLFKDYFRNIFTDFFALSGVDTIGIDLYSNDRTYWNGALDDIGFDIPQNLSHIGETGSQKGNIVNMLMDNFSRGTGTILFELRTSLNRAYDCGIYEKSSTEWIERDGTGLVNKTPVDLGEEFLVPESKTAEIRAFNNMIYKADTLIATLPISNIVAFNVDNADVVENEVATLDGYTINYSSAIGGEAMALKDTNGDVILLSLYDGGMFNISGIQVPAQVEYGRYVNGVWVSEGTLSTVGNAVTLPAESCVRIPA